MSRTLATTRTPRPQQGNDTLFASYEAIACLSEEMVGAAEAEAGDWAGVSALEREWAVYMERLGRPPSRPVLSQAELQRKRDLMIRILANDARVRALVPLHRGAMTVCQRWLQGRLWPIFCGPFQ
ncbi:hypothetical protein LMG10661_01448 [Ralstonia syzygii subsp. syzygii]|nr:hypothetical protein LMG10661_01448 [Ralstonia syzygii subsp. syzygii]